MLSSEVYLGHRDKGHPIAKAQRESHQVHSMRKSVLGNVFWAIGAREVFHCSVPSSTVQSLGRLEHF